MWIQMSGDEIIIYVSCVNQIYILYIPFKTYVTISANDWTH